MNRYKNYMFSLGFIVLILLLWGVQESGKTNSKEDSSFKPGVYTINDLQILDTKTNSIIEIGMSLEKVRELLGKESEIDFKGIYHFSGLNVFFRNNKAVALMVNAGENIVNRYISNRGVGLSTGLDSVLEKYGETEVEDLYDNYTINYIGKLNGNQLTTNTENDPKWGTENQDRIYVINFTFFNNKNKTVSGIFISDHTFAYKMK
jgi:hypothetical protein